MTNFEIYRKEVYELVTETEHRLHLNIHTNLEAYIVNLIAHYFDKPDLNYTEPVAITYMTLKQQHTANMANLQKLADVCLLVSGVCPFNASRYGVDPKYYTDIGRTCYYEASQCPKPPDQLLAELSQYFPKLRDIISASLDQTTKSLRQKRKLTEAGSELYGNIGPVIIT